MKSINTIPEGYQPENLIRDEQYKNALKRVKRIKGFYVHLTVYVFVNAIIIFSNIYGNSNQDTVSWSWQTFSTALFWGIGLLAHGLSVFGRNIFFGQNWEERKIKEFMDKEKSEKWE